MENSPGYGTFAKYAADIQHCWKGMLYMCIASLFIAVFYIFLLRFITKPLLYVSMLVIQISFIALGMWCFMKRQEYDSEKNKKDF